MHLEHSFSVNAGVEDTWRTMLDPERMAKCLPGAALDSVKNGVASGAIRVRFGPIGPTYRGTAQVVDKDDDGHRAIVEAQGGTRAHGDATVRLIVTLSAFGDSTNVMLQSDLRLTGRAAEELDTEIISDAGDRLCRQVAARLNDMLKPPPRREPPSPPPAAVEQPPAPPEAAEQPAVDTPAVETPAVEPPAPQPTPAAEPVGGQDAVRRFAPIVAVLVILLLLRRRRRRRRR